jgi:hypothetical protein
MVFAAAPIESDTGQATVPTGARVSGRAGIDHQTISSHLRSLYL